jgi:ubiquinone/menaquinone biosynthesis C-methylase UbiE
MASAMPTGGPMVDLGCGWGLFAFALCEGSPHRTVIAIDHDHDRLRTAAGAAKRQRAACRVVFERGDIANYLEKVQSGSLAGIAMIDVLHYFDDATQLSLIDHASRALMPGGVLLVRDIDADDGLRGALNKFYERIATGVGFTKSASAKLFFHGRSQWKRLLETAGFQVSSRRCGLPVLADVLFIATRIT